MNATLNQLKQKRLKKYNVDVVKNIYGDKSKHQRTQFHQNYLLTKTIYRHFSYYLY